MPSTKSNRAAADAAPDDPAATDWQRRVLARSLRDARQRSIDRGHDLIRAAEALLRQSDSDDITVQKVADEAGQSLRTLYQYFESKEDLLLAVFEEAMRTYADLIRSAIRGLDDPLERLGGAIVAAARMPDSTGGGTDRVLARLRLRLGAYEPELIARSQLPVSTLFRELVGAAVDAKQIDTDPEGTAYLITALNTSFIITRMLGNDYGLTPPDVEGLCSFSLHGMHANVDRRWVRTVSRRVKLPTEPKRG